MNYNSMQYTDTFEIKSIMTTQISELFSDTQKTNIRVLFKNNKIIYVLKINGNRRYSTGQHIRPSIG